MQPEDQPKNSNSKKVEKPLSETIRNAHSSGDGSLRLSEDGLVEPPGETIADADAEAHKEGETKEDEY